MNAWAKFVATIGGIGLIGSIGYAVVVFSDRGDWKVPAKASAGPQNQASQISHARARRIAAEYIRGQAKAVSYIRKNGIKVYEVKVLKGRKVYTVVLDAKTGFIQ